MNGPRVYFLILNQSEKKKKITPNHSKVIVSLVSIKFFKGATSFTLFRNQESF